MMDFIKNNLLLSVGVAYILVMSLISIVVCIWDKKVAPKNKVELRIPEKVLLILSALGGSVAMFLCMLLIRHKTKHAKFMLGIPPIILAQAAIVFALFHFEILTIIL